MSAVDTDLEAAIAGGWASVCPTPVRYQRMVGHRFADSVFRIDNVSDVLQRVGLECRGQEFDAFDVWNAALYSGIGTTRPALEMRYSAMLLMLSPRALTGVFRVAPELSGVAAVPLVEGAEVRSEGPSGDGHEWSVQMSCDDKKIEDPAVSGIVFELISAYRYHYTQPDLARRVDLTRVRKVGDCRALANVLTIELQSAGVEARYRDAYIVGDLSVREHSLVEVREGRSWKPVDVTLALLSRQFAWSVPWQRFIGHRNSRVVLVPLDALPVEGRRISVVRVERSEFT